MIESSKGKGLRRGARLLAHCRILVEEGLIEVELVPTSQQEADLSSKQFRSPTAYWRAALGPCGDHPALREMQEKARHQRGSRKQRKLNTSHMSIINVDSEALDSDIEDEQNDEIKALVSTSHTEELTEEAIQEVECAIVRMNTLFNRDANRNWGEEAEELVDMNMGHLVAQRFSKDEKENKFIKKLQRKRNRK